MKKSQPTDNRNLEHFQRLLSDRLDDLDRRSKKGGGAFYTGTGRLLIYFAFERIRKNEYWNCVKCGGDITVERMLADPTTLTCTGCEPHRVKSRKEDNV